MTLLDIKTVIIIFTAVDILCSIMIFTIWKNNHKRLDGTFLWFADFLFQTIAMILIFLRGYVPDFTSIVLSNTLVISGAILFNIGIGKFTGKKLKQPLNFLLLISMPIALYYFYYIQNHLWIRNLIISSILLIVCIHCFHFIFFSTNPTMRKISRPVGIVYAGYCMLSLFRIIVTVISHNYDNDFFKSGDFTAFIMIGYQILFILLTFSITLMVNNLFKMEISNEEEKFSKAFHSSPYAVMMTRLHDGRIFDVNRGFEEITGFSLNESRNKTTIELQLWVNENDRLSFVKELSLNGKAHEMEFEFKTKHGKILTGLLSADIIIVNDEKSIIASISDITKRKADAMLVAKLLTEKDIILKEVHHRIKNNMNVIYGVLYLQSIKQSNPQLMQVLQDAAGRVNSMMVLYDKLYRSDNHSAVSSREYFTQIISEISGIFPDNNNLTIDTKIDDFIINQELLSPLGIIFNELITNSIKYAFVGKTDAKISITITNTDNNVTIDYSDNGTGLPDSFSIEKSAGFGMQLIDMLVKQIYASMKIEVNNGTRFVITFNL